MSANAGTRRCAKDLPRNMRRNQSRTDRLSVSSADDRLERRVIFRKTKMCKFFLLDSCAKGSECRFAHDKSELESLPDLSYTKVCKLLISVGECNDPDCKYAHSSEELRAPRLTGTGVPVVLANGTESVESDASILHKGLDPCSQWTDVLPAFAPMNEHLPNLVVKNTFFDIEMETTPTGCPRSKTWACSLCPKTDESPMQSLKLEDAGERLTLPEQTQQPCVDVLRQCVAAASKSTESALFAVAEEESDDSNFCLKTTNKEHVLKHVCEEMGKSDTETVEEMPEIVIKNTFIEFKFEPTFRHCPQSKSWAGNLCMFVDESPVTDRNDSLAATLADKCNDARDVGCVRTSPLPRLHMPLVSPLFVSSNVINVGTSEIHDATPQTLQSIWFPMAATTQ